MKYLLLLLLPCLAIAQDTAADFANNVFEACKANDEKRFEQFLASQQELMIFIKSIDATVPDGIAAQVFEKYSTKAQKGFTIWQNTAKELRLDLASATITKTEVESRPLELKREGKPVNTINVTSIRVFFDCSGKKLCFMISDAILVKGAYYLGENYVQLYPLD